jgi:acetyltransferase-like isoleucine patch superfamily enzyme
MVRLLAALANGGVRLVGTIGGELVRFCLRRGWLYFPFVSEALSTVPFAVGWKLRQAVYARVLPRIGSGAVLHHGVTLEDPRTEFGDDVWIGSGTYVDYAIVGDHVLVGPHAVLLAGGRQHRANRTDVPIKQQGNPPKQPLEIGEGAWIGANATVMAAVRSHAIVGAGSVVTREVPAFAVVAGNPARVLRVRRTAEELAQEPSDAGR